MTTAIHRKSLLFASLQYNPEREMLDIIPEILQDMTHYRVECTRSGENAIESAQKGCNTVILLDTIVDVGRDAKLSVYFAFPQDYRPGLWTLDMIKEHAPTQRVIVMSHDFPGLEDSCMFAGAEAYFRIPFSPLTIVDHLVEKDPSMAKASRYAAERRYG